MISFPFRLGLAFAIAAVGAAFAGDAALDRFGDFTYDRDRWIVTGEGPRFTVRERAADARDDGELAFVSVKPAGEDVCAPGDFPERRSGYYGRTHIATIARPGFDIHVAQYDLGCRNRRPPAVEACTTFRAKTYRLSSPVVSCRGGPGSYDGFVAFLESLQAAGP